MGVRPISFVQMSEAALRRALADEHRVRVVAELRGAPDGLDVRELAGRLGIHANTVRWHLGLLADAGLIDSSPAPNGKRGRPRMLYVLRPGAAEPARDEHRLLATILTGSMAALGDGARRAEEAGRAWGRYLVRRPSPLRRVTEEEAIAEVTRILDDEGFAAEAHGREVHMRRCPFHDLAETNPEIVCGVHHGLLSGALEELGGELDVDGLDVFVRPDLCVARLRKRELTERLEVGEPNTDEA
jgi:predicted ArsR family transcriptional regulator